MSDNIYVDYYDPDPELVRQLLQSPRAEDQLNAMLYTVLGLKDYTLSEPLIWRNLHSNDELLRKNAVLCIGHLVRIHHNIPLSKYLPFLNDLLIRQEEPIIDVAESALESIWRFYAKAHLKTVDTHSCTGRFFRTLHETDLAELSQDHENAIKNISDWLKVEQNPSVRNIQRSCLDFLQ